MLLIETGCVGEDIFNLCLGNLFKYFVLRVEKKGDNPSKREYHFFFSANRS